MRAVASRLKVLAKKFIKKLLERVGIRLRLARAIQGNELAIRWGGSKRHGLGANDFPLMVDDWTEALFRARGGKETAFRCPLDLCIDVNGLNFSRLGWHPFSAALEEYLSEPDKAYSGSILEAFYEKWQPLNARDALIDRSVSPEIFSALPPHMLYHFPWSARTLDEADRAVRTNMYNDNLEHGHGHLNRQDSFQLKHHGPVSRTMGEFEYLRLKAVCDSIAQHGFSRERGHARVLAIKRGMEFRFLSFGGGLHRTAAMRALGETHIPAFLQSLWFVDTDELHQWPQVRQGVWDAESASRYISHLFEFDGHSWAGSKGLLAAGEVEKHSASVRA